METGNTIDFGGGAWIERSALRFHFARSGGPGGQNVNKVNTKAELRIRPEEIHGLSGSAVFRLIRDAGHRMTTDGELLIVADTERHQDANKKACIERLSALVKNAQHEPKPRKKSRPSRGSVQRRLESKKAHSKIKKERSSRNFGD